MLEEVLSKELDNLDLQYLNEADYEITLAAVGAGVSNGGEGACEGKCETHW